MSRSSSNFVLLATTASNTVLAEHAGQARRSAYTAYGHRSPVPGDARPGFNGELAERTGVQILASYRGYDPVLMHFHNPDELSPFGRGGLNAYGYCLGDPVNHVDPTGNVPEWVMPAVGVAFSVAGVVATAGLAGPAILKAVSIASAAGSALTAGGSFYAQYGMGEENASRILGYVSTGLGALSLVAGLASGSRSFADNWAKARTRAKAKAQSRAASRRSREARIINAEPQFKGISELQRKAAVALEELPTDRAINGLIERVSAKKQLWNQHQLANRPLPPIPGQSAMSLEPEAIYDYMLPRARSQSPYRNTTIRRGTYL